MTKRQLGLLFFALQVCLLAAGMTIVPISGDDNSSNSSADSADSSDRDPAEWQRILAKCVKK